MYFCISTYTKYVNELLEISENLIHRANEGFTRYLFNEVNWNDRLIGIKGSRGVGKTTMLLQWLKREVPEPTKRAYVSLDELYFTTHSLLDMARDFHQHGGKVLVLDEVHKYPGWSREIKNLYDRYEDLQIVFTGSSIIELSKQEADLSRRAIIYELPGLSYREYLELEHQRQFPAFTLEEVVGGKVNFRKIFPDEFRPLAHFKQYLQIGFYPFFREYRDTYLERIKQLVRTIVEYDMAELKGFDVRHAKKMLQLFYVIAQQVPFKPNINSLSNKTKIHRNTIYNYLHFLQEARLVDLLYPENKGVSTLQKPEKLYLSNTNLLYALSEEDPSVGTVREVFFHNQISVKHRVNHSDRTDFYVDGKYHFEVGGKGKGRKQITGLENAWIVKDDLEYPIQQSMPLWLFGFLY